MRIFYIKNFRKGFATNSSSTHSLIYKNKDDMFKDLNVFELNYYDRFDRTIAATREAKIKYIAANCFYNKFLFEIMCKYYPEMEQYIPLIEKQKKANDLPYDSNEDREIFGMCTRENLTASGNHNIEFNIKTLCNIIDNDDIIIVGGSDEEDFVYSTCENHEKITTADEANRKYEIVKNGNYWIGLSEYNGNRIRFNQKPEDCIPEYPELIDLKITNMCEHGCPFCYMGSNAKGKHANLDFLKRIISHVSSNDYSNHKKRIEFAIGGGNVLLYPQLEDLFKYISEQGHIINTTVNIQDIPHICMDGEFKYCIDTNTGNENGLLNIFNKYVKGLGVSVCDEKDLDIFVDHNLECLDCNITLHIIPELIGVEKTRKIIERAKSLNYYNILFLGYKTNNKGKTQKYLNFSDNNLNSLFNGLYCVGIDTTFANKYKDWIIEHYEANKTVTWNEGEYSMYIDGVTENAYKSSYQLDKPYNLTFGKYIDKNKAWFNIIEAFSNIRKDNGFKLYEK